MNLTNCKHCNHKVSKTATSCPNCGGVIAEVNPAAKFIIGAIILLAIFAMLEDMFK
ncbi:hypothetical protein [Aliarcobacter butzleri]|uniref:hypothetical protein n=1 Tax=Aliarcobacter butzleri TaxID=28197 RepID=UPI001869EEC1|nr:hypothetical protein [Aliarcobacter butzleri]